MGVKAPITVLNFRVAGDDAISGTELERDGCMEGFHLSGATLVVDRTPAARIFSSAACASGALFLGYLSKAPEEIRLVPFSGTRTDRT